MVLKYPGNEHMGALVVIVMIYQEQQTEEDLKELCTD